MIPINKETRSYKFKIVETPTTIEVWEYIDDPVFYSVKVDSETLHNLNDRVNEISDDSIPTKTNNQYDSLKRKQKHYEHMRWEIAHIVDCNFDNKTKFMTLTFKENEQDINFTNLEFNKFIKRLNYDLYKQKTQQLKYLAVWEKQKRGAIHYHVIFFDLPFIKIKNLQNIWGHGFVKLNKIDVDSQENRGRYVSKYFSKDLEFKEHKKKAFFKSQNLKKPTIRRINSLQPIDLPKTNIIYTKEYTRNIPDFQSPDKNFKNSTVHYTKYRKGLINNDYSN
ncbi:Rep protein [Metasolibacillus sp.]|uniref:rolling circle replication-associated protein n=1 Tax=Metasolibacillus sp. TaxID=2703680 RepID=UPI0025DCA925|nr:Rep protein [Metasolibacillus sp.]MCT6925128.1 Rep protein [Metasolibacillus sp.]MCT6941332.1 Rep protein [Metasolibacillus sp.]